ncbi:hypothetical protein GCM10023075_35140 [Streptosporangium album]
MTVSRVLDDRPGVSEAARDAVRAAPALGHERIGTVLGPPGRLFSRREVGTLSALAGHWA